MKSMFLYYLDLRGLSDDLSIVHVGPADGRGPSARIYTGFNAFYVLSQNLFKSVTKSDFGGTRFLEQPFMCVDFNLLFI